MSSSEQIAKITLNKFKIIKRRTGKNASKRHAIGHLDVGAKALQCPSTEARARAMPSH